MLVQEQLILIAKMKAILESFGSQEVFNRELEDYSDSFMELRDIQHELGYFKDQYSSDQMDDITDDYDYLMQVQPELDIVIVGIKFTEQSMVISTKNIGGNVFALIFLAIPDSNYEYVKSWDYVVTGPNWCSGHLKALHGCKNEEILEYWDNTGMNDVRDAWDAHNSRVIEY